MTTIAPDVAAFMNRLTGDEKHSAAATSTLDVVRVLYDDILGLTPADMSDPDRHRYYLSKGHGPAAYYAVLASHGFFPEEWLDDFASFDSPLGMHPDRTLVPGVEIGSGSLGHGLPLAVGSALGLRIQRRAARVFVLVGDAELDEGSNAEAIELASAVGLANLTLIAIDNNSSTYAVRGRIAARFEVNGWATQEVDGHDHVALRQALSTPDAHRPTAVVARVEDKA